MWMENTADDPSRRRPDITKAKTLLGWEPKVGRRGKGSAAAAAAVAAVAAAAPAAAAPAAAAAAVAVAVAVREAAAGISAGVFGMHGVELAQQKLQRCWCRGVVGACERQAGYRGWRDCVN
jgi:hypothetical protein